MDAKTLLRDGLDEHVFLYSDCTPVEGYTMARYQARVHLPIVRA